MWRRMLILVAVLALTAAGCGADITVATEDTGSGDGGPEAADGVPAPAEGEPSPATDEPTPPAATPAPTATSAPTPLPPTAAPEPSAEPTATPEPGTGVADLFTLAEELSPEFISCALEQLVDDPELLDVLVDASVDDIEDLDGPLRARVIDLALACLDDDSFAALVVAGIEQGAGTQLPAGTGACFAEQFSTDDERRALVELGLATTSDTLDPAVVQVALDAVLTCITPEDWTALILDEASADELAGSIDESCMNSLFADDAFVSDLLLLALSGDLPEDDIAPDQLSVLRPFLDCIEFGPLVAAEAAADGIELSPETVDCITESVREVGLVDAFFIGDEPSEADLAVVLFACLTPEELAQLAG